MAFADLVEFWREVNWRRPYGFRSAEYGTGYHRGKDLAGGYAKPVYALTSGTIVKTGFSSNIGHYIVVDTGRTGVERYEIYCHMFDGEGPKSGRINAGDWIGRLAVKGESTGSSWTGAHLHFVVTGFIDGAYNTNRTTINPDPYIISALTGTSGGGSVPFEPEGFLMALAPAQQGQVYDALIKHGPTGDYFSTDALIDIERKENQPRLDGIVARTDAANTRLDAIIEMLKVLDPAKATDIEAFDAKLRESEARTIAATQKAVEDSSKALRTELIAALSNDLELDTEAITAAVDDAFSKVFVQPT